MDKQEERKDIPTPKLSELTLTSLQEIAPTVAIVGKKRGLVVIC